MKTMMYLIVPEDGFPTMVCAIRRYDGECRFYTTEGESANELLSSMHRDATEMEDTIKSLTDDNAKLQELCKAWRKFSYELFDDFIGEPEMSDDFMELDDRMRELGIEVPNGD